ncbi:hypothetical protein ACHAWF_009206 [Thalassiosira exigua]
MEEVGHEQAGFGVVTTKDFLKREAMTGNLRNRTTGKAEWLRDVTFVSSGWDPRQCLAAFPSNNGPLGSRELEGVLARIKEGEFPKWPDYQDKPPPNLSDERGVVLQLEEALHLRWTDAGSAGGALPEQPSDRGSSLAREEVEVHAGTVSIEV